MLYNFPMLIPQLILIIQVFIAVVAFRAPRGACGIFAAVFLPFDVGVFAQDAGVHKRVDVKPYPVVQVGSQPMGCSSRGFQRTKMS